MSSISLLRAQDSIEQAAESVKPWDPSDFVGQSLLQEAIRNHGRVDMMQKRNGEKIAVKRMPNRWVREGPIEFNEQCAIHLFSSLFSF